MKILLCAILLLPTRFLAQNLNHLNKQGQKTGKWVTYADSAQTIKLFEGRFRHDRPVGRQYFYNTAGVLDRREQPRFRALKTRFYHPNGRIRLKGRARLENLPDRIHYYYYGRWKAYDDKGKLVKYYYYQKGQLLKTIYLDKQSQINDSLIEALTAIDRGFTAHNMALTDSLNAHRKEPETYQRFKKQLALKDSLSFAMIDRILDTYGYPRKAVAADATPIPFYILGFAPVPMREKHLEKLILAATREDISMKSLAFFIDKIKVAKGEKQVYGTQFYQKNGERILYPVENEADLKARRASVGLEAD